MKRLGLVVIIAISLIVATIFIRSNSSGDSKSAPGSFKTRDISASPEYSAKYKKPKKGDPVEMAYEFFELNRDLLQIQNPREELVLKDKNSRMVFFHQAYHGMGPLSSIVIRFSREGELKSVEGKYVYDINLPPNYSVDSLSAAQKALGDIGVESAPHPQVICPSKPVIAHSSEFHRRDENRLYLVWPVKVFPDTTGLTSKGNTIYYAYYIDALDGSILKKGRDRTIEDLWESPHRVPAPK